VSEESYLLSHLSQRAAHYAACVLSLSVLALAGCGSAGKNPEALSSPVIMGTQPNSLPAPPAQTNINRYAGIDVVTGNQGVNWNWTISHPAQSYSYQLQQGVGSGAPLNSGGVFSSFGDLEYLSDTINVPYTSSGFATEINTGVSFLEDGYQAAATGPLAVGVLQQTQGCPAPNGSVKLVFLEVPTYTNYSSATDALYGSTSLSYSNGVFHYTSTQQLASGGSSASTNTIPLTDSYCIQALAGYGMQSVPMTGANGSSTPASTTTLSYLSSSGMLVGAIEQTNASIGYLAIVEPAQPISIADVTAGTYRGFYNSRTQGTYGDPAYFGTHSAWVTSPVFSQSSGTLIGGYEDYYTLLFTNPAPTVTGNIVLSFKTEDANHPGLFPSATLKEPDPNNLCKASQQSIGPDGQTYCTFPVTALIAKTYGKYVIFLAGPEPTTGAALFYALVED
jgi:hypothetical protein